MTKETEQRLELSVTLLSGQIRRLERALAELAARAAWAGSGVSTPERFSETGRAALSGVLHDAASGEFENTLSIPTDRETR